MAGSLRRNTDYVNVVLDRLLGHFFGRGKHGRQVNIETHICKGCRNYLGTAIVSILAHFTHQHTGTTAMLFSESLDIGGNFIPVVVVLIGAAVHTGYRLSLRIEATEFALHGKGDFTYGSTNPGGFHRQIQQVAFTAYGALVNRFQRIFNRFFIAAGTNTLQRCHLRLADFLIVDIENIHVIFGFQTVFVYTDNHVFAAIDAGLLARSGFFDAQFGHAGFDGLCHTAFFFHFLDQLPGFFGDVVGQRLHHVGTTPGINHLGDAGFFLDDELGVASNAGRELSRQCNCFVQRVGVQRLGAAEYCGHRLNRGTNHVVVGVLLGQRPAGCLAMGAQHFRPRALRFELIDNASPQQTRGAEFGDLHIEIHANAPEKGQAPREFVDVQTRRQRGANIFFTVGQGIGQLQRRIGTGFLNVVAGNGDGVELGHVIRRVSNDIADNFHRRLRRINVGIAHHEFFQNVVLNGARQLLLADALLFGRDNIAGQHRKHRAIHGHGHGNLVQRNVVKQHFHVFDRVDGHTSFADVPRNARVIGVITAVGCQVKRYRDPLPAGSQCLAVKVIGLFGGGETCILANGPGTTGIHGRLRPPDKGLHTRHGVSVRQSFDVFLAVQRIDVNAFRCMPNQIVQAFTALAHLLVGKFIPGFASRLGCVVVLVCHMLLPVSDSAARDCPASNKVDQ